MVREGVLGPAESAVFIAAEAKHVDIHNEGLDRLSDEMLSSMKDGQLKIPDPGAGDIHPIKEHPLAVDWVFITDALNFCFWTTSKDQAWTVDGHTGYFALEAALHRAVKEGKDIVNSHYYSKITEEELKHILRGDTSAEIPLFKQRISILHQVGKILLDKYSGSFKNCLKNANKSAEKLLKLVVEDFPCFRDEATYKGQKVSFYKRAQILVADIWSFFDKTGWGEFYDIEKITMFADYRVPQVLVHFGVLSYSEELMDKLKKDVLLEPGSVEEVEIRGCSINAVELLKRRIEDKKSQEIQVPNSILIDYYLWCYRRKHAADLEKVPFHKTLGIFY